jgi:hypothetical protein
MVELTVGGNSHKSQPISRGCLGNFSDETGTYQTSPLIYNKQKRMTEMMRSIQKKLYSYSLNVPNSFQSYPVAETNHLSNTERRDRLYIKG